MSLAGQIESAVCPTPTFWWLGKQGFAIKHASTIFYVDACLADNAVLASSDVTHADLVLCSNIQPEHFDPETVRGILGASLRAKLVLPKGASEEARSLGISYSRMTTTDSGLRVEFFKRNEYARIYSVPAAFSRDSGPPALHWSPTGGFPRLSFLIRFGTCTIYHHGGTALYDELADRLRPYNVTVALLPIREPLPAAAQLAADIGAKWVVPIEEEPERIERFTAHMLGHRPELRFKVLARGEQWAVPE